jgi:hypothetical protein
MSGITFSLWGIVAVFVLFMAIGAVLFVQSLWTGRGREAAAGGEQQPRQRITVREGVRRYYGPVTARHALLGPVRRVVLELVAATCGFPGFGWLMSARPAIGLPMIILGSATVYGFYPAFLIMSGRINASPLVALEYLPVLAVASAGTLAVVEYRSARAVSGGS